jgi:hypothetical protein
VAASLLEHLVRRSAQWERPWCQARRELRRLVRGSSSAQGLLSVQPRLERAGSALRVVPSVRSVQLSGRLHSEAVSVRQDAAAAPSSFRQAEGRWSVARFGFAEPAWWQAPAAAWRQPVGAASASAQAMASSSGMQVVAASARQAASALQALLPAEEAASASGAQVQPPEVAEEVWVPSARQPGAAEAVAAPSVRQPEAAGAVPALDAAAEPQQAVGAAEPDGVAVQPPGAAAEGLPDAEGPQPGVVGQPVPAPSVRQPVAEHPSAPPWAYRPGLLLPFPWLAPRQAARSAHAMRKSRAASPSR